MARRIALILALLAGSAAAICSPGSPARIFSNGFEDGSDRCWTGPLTCLDQLGQQAPACADSEPFPWWMDRCEEGWPCYRECSAEGTPDACLLLQIDYLRPGLPLSEVEPAAGEDAVAAEEPAG